MWQEALKSMQEEEEKELLHFCTCVGCIKSSGQSIQHQHKTDWTHISSNQKDEAKFRMQYLQCMQSARLNYIPSNFFRLFTFMFLLWIKILTECRQWNLGVMKSTGRICINFSGTGSLPTKSWHLLWCYIYTFQLWKASLCHQRDIQSFTFLCHITQGCWLSLMEMLDFFSNCMKSHPKKVTSKKWCD